MKNTSPILETELLEHQVLEFIDLCRAVRMPEQTVIEMVEYGVIEPAKGHTPQQWQFSAWTLKRTQKAVRLHRDLNINYEGLGLVLDLLEEVEQLRRQIHND